MYKKIIHIALLALSLLHLPGCRSEEEIPTPATKGSGLSIRVAFQAGENIPGCEMVQTLRLIVIDENGNVDKISDAPLSPPKLTKATEESGTGSNRYIYTYEADNEEITPGQKTIYALANAEGIIQEIENDLQKPLSSSLGNELKERLANYEMSDQMIVKTSNDPDWNVPITSRANHVTIQPGSAEDPQEVEIVMVYAAVKFDLSFSYEQQNSSSNGQIEIESWQIAQIADRSYLIPHIEDNAWETLLAGCGNAYTGIDSEQNWVFDYNIPEQTGHGIHIQALSPALTIKDNETRSDGITYYLHESKYFPEERDSDSREEEGNAVEEPKEQQYTLTAKVKIGNSSFFLSGKFHNLKSLVRNTHVIVEAKVQEKNINSGDNTLEVRVRQWINQDPIEGGWEEVDDNKWEEVD
ncbi:hypothetical protein [Parabacteroides sp.]